MNAGPIWSNEDAQTKCPTTCSNVSLQWNKQWTTTVPGQMSVCGCIPDS
ncbi:MAG: mannan-binding lectin [Arenicella sp.]